jgi:phosphoribosylanthranilate isomerase
MLNAECHMLLPVKICGITRYEDARLALDCGAWAIGFVFHPSSPRAITRERAAEIVRRLPAGPLAIGVFVDLPVDDVNAIVAEVGLRGVQLHGAEPPELAARVRAEIVVKAFRVGEGFDPAGIEAYRGCRILLDACRPGVPGGTGATFDWSVAREVGKRVPFILAGGLNPENIEAAIEEARPEGIDVSSGVEARPGIKDAAKVRRLFDAVARADKGGCRPQAAGHRTLDPPPSCSL